MADSPKRTVRLDYWIAAILLLLMATIAFVNVLSRYLFHFSFAATEELTIHMFVWLTVVGSGIAFERSGHLGMVTLFNLFPPGLQKFALVLSAALSALLFVVVNIYMIQAIYDEITLFRATSAALGIPVWLYYAGVPLLSVFVFRGVWRDMRARLTRL